MPRIALVEEGEVRVKCPYCTIGFARVKTISMTGMFQIPDIREPRKCNSPFCGEYFYIRPRIEWEGLKRKESMKEEPKQSINKRGGITIGVPAANFNTRGN